MFTPFFSRSLTILVRQQVMAQIKTFAFLDLETTGLPSMENNKTKITELTVIAVHTEHLTLGVVPRVQNKLTLCFNPQKLISSESERITGLSNYQLEHLSPFTSNTVHTINSFLEHSAKPICLVAHNGKRFDYPILRKEIESTGVSLLENILCIDSLEAFRELHYHIQENIPVASATKPPDTVDSIPIEFTDGFDEMLCKVVDDYESDTNPVNKALRIQKINEKTPHRQKITLKEGALDLALKRCYGDGKDDLKGVKKLKATTSRKKLNFGVSFQLGEVYQRLTNQEAVNAHQAENDVIMLAMCAATLGERFVDWANANAQQFGEVPAMVPGKKIGT